MAGKKQTNDVGFSEGNHQQILFEMLADAFAYCRVILDATNRPVDLECILINPAFEKQFGVAKDETTGKRVSEIFPSFGGEVFHWIKAIGKIGLTRESKSFDIFLPAQGQWYRVAAFSPSPDHVATIFQDITDRKRTEEALAASELKYRLLFENIDDAIFVVEIINKVPERIREVNAVACRRLGYSREELLTLSFKDIDADQDYENRDWPSLITQMQGQGEVIFERIHRAKDGTLIPVEICLKLFTSDGKLFGLNVVRDLRSRIRTERMLKASYERLQRSHLFNELINSESLSGKKVQEMVLTTGLKIPAAVSCYLLVIEEWKGKSGDYWQQHPYELYFLSNSIIEFLESDESLIVWSSPNGIGILSNAAGDGESKAAQEATAQRLREMIEGNIAALTVKIGIAARSAAVTEIRSLYRQSCIAVDTGRKVWPERQLYHYLDMGVFQVLPLIDQTEIAFYVERHLGALIKYERKRKNELLVTLEAILESRNLTEAAKKLYIHQKTLDFRKRRIEQIQGVSLECQEARTAMLVALKMLKIVRGVQI